MKKLIFLFLLYVPQTIAGDIGRMFADGVFGTKWGDTITEVEKVFTSGEVKEYVKIIQFVVEDGRTILGIEREEDSLFRFGFDSENRLTAVGVYFDSDDYAKLLQKLITQFGQHEELEPGSYNVLKWSEDEGVTLSLMAVPDGFGVATVLSIGYSSLQKPKMSKEDSGF